MKYTYFELDSLVKDLGVKAGTLYALSNNIDAHYRQVSIPKSDGGYRKLSCPDYILKKVQRKISEVILSGMPVSEYACAYVYGGSPKKNARKHLKKETILKLDIRKYFDHVTYPLIREKVFTPDIFSESNRILLSLLCSYDEVLPQGAPTSPAISNILLYDFDNRIGEWCRQKNITYTRYCDDLTFSSNGMNKDEVIGKVADELKAYGLFINRKKTKFIQKGRRKKITGIIVNDRLSAPVEYRRKIRQEMYYIRRYGIDDHLKKIIWTDSKEKYLRSMLGRIDYVLSIDRNSGPFQQYRNEVKEYLR